MIRSVRRRLPELFLAALAGLLLLAFVPAAGANSALDQYVEQVPGPVGNEPPTVKPAPTPTPKPPKKTGSAPDGTGVTPPVATATVPATVVTDPATSQVDKPKHKHRSKANHHASPHHRSAGGPGTDQPRKMAAWSKAAKVSGFNAPLAVFVGLTALGLVALAVWRRTRGESR